MLFLKLLLLNFELVFNRILKRCQIFEVFSLRSAL